MAAAKEFFVDAESFCFVLFFTFTDLDLHVSKIPSIPIGGYSVELLVQRLAYRWHCVSAAFVEGKTFPHSSFI